MLCRPPRPPSFLTASPARAGREGDTLIISILAPHRRGGCHVVGAYLRWRFILPMPHRLKISRRSLTLRTAVRCAMRLGYLRCLEHALNKRYAHYDFRRAASWRDLLPQPSRCLALGRKLGSARSAISLAFVSYYDRATSSAVGRGFTLGISRRRRRSAFAFLQRCATEIRPPSRVASRAASKMRCLNVMRPRRLMTADLLLSAVPRPMLMPIAILWVTGADSRRLSSIGVGRRLNIFEAHYSPGDPPFLARRAHDYGGAARARSTPGSQPRVPPAARR